MARNPKLRRKNGYGYSEAGGQPRHFGKIDKVAQESPGENGCSAARDRCRTHTVRATRDLAMYTAYQQEVVPFLIKKAV
jgi:hypothetical protein